MKIAVIGTGYVGLVAGVCFADSGHDVVCVDTDPAKIEALRGGEVPIYEPGLGSILDRALREGRISFTTSHADAIPGCDVVFIAVGTPEGPDGAPDLSYVDAAVQQSVAPATDSLVLVMKSTVPVGTAARMRKICAEHSSHTIHVVSNPEFLAEGKSVEDFVRPDRVVIGTDSDEAFEVMRTLYAPFVLSGKPILRMSNVSAEVTKYAANAMLATRISFMNEVARLCDTVGANVKDIAKGIGTDGRIGKPFLYAGCGYGGSCFPKDTQGLMHIAKAVGVDMSIVEAVEAVNDAQKELLAHRVIERFGKDLSGKRFALWGLAFKPQTDDVREAPALIIADILIAHGAEVIGTDPEGLDNFRKAFGERMHYTTDPYDAAKGADALILATEWLEFRAADFPRLAGLMKQKVVFDGRNVLDAERARAAGFEYEGIGLGTRQQGAPTS